MRFLPKANPLYEKVSATNVIIPDVLEKLGKGGFSGYLRFKATRFESYCIFANGKLIGAACSEDNLEKINVEAIASMFDKIFSVNGVIDIYKSTIDIAMCVYALVLGVRFFESVEVQQVDLKGMLVHLKAQGLNGVVHFYTSERHGMMFYKNGLLIGYYHDGSNTIEASPEESRKVALLDGARVDVCSTNPIELLMQNDLLQIFNPNKLWETAKSRLSPARQEKLPFPDVTMLRINDNLHADLVDDLIEISCAYLYKEGRAVIEKSLKAVGGSSTLINNTAMVNFLKLVEAEARTIDSHARTEEMIDLIRSEIVGRFAL